MEGFNVREEDVRDGISFSFEFVGHVFSLLRAKGLVPLACLLAKVPVAKFACEHWALHKFLLFFEVFKLFFCFLTSTDLFHGQSKGHRLLLPKRNYRQFRFLLFLFKFALISSRHTKFLEKIVLVFACKSLLCRVEFLSFVHENFLTDFFMPFEGSFDEGSTTIFARK